MKIITRLIAAGIFISGASAAIAGVSAEHQAMINSFYEHAYKCEDGDQTACGAQQDVSKALDAAGVVFGAEMEPYYQSARDALPEVTQVTPAAMSNMRSAFNAHFKENRIYIQRVLQNSGHYSGKLDGAFGPATAQAIASRLKEIKAAKPETDYSFATRQTTEDAISIILIN